jgi:hypothetical protein
MTKRYHISYASNLLHLSIHDRIIDVHPLVWRLQSLDNVLIAWNEIPEEMENQIEDLEKQRIQLSTERTLRWMKEDLKR